MKRTIITLLLAALAATASAEEPKSLADRQAEFLSWKFGMFLHFNMATFTNRQFTNGYEDPTAFAPAKLDCGQWADAAKAAGMKYAVLTVKHTGGWCLWPSQHTTHGVQSFTNYKGGKGDIVREFVDAFRARGLKIGFYYCAPGTYDNKYGNKLPEGKPSLRGMPPEAAGDRAGFMKKQFTELLTNYGPIDLIWVDQFRFICTAKQWREIKAHVKSLQPNCLVIANNSHNFDETDIYGYELPAYTGKRRNNLPQADHSTPSEVCDHICVAWFWKQGQSEKTLRSAADIADSVKKWNARRANYLLNVPPDPTGRLPESFVRRLKEIGGMLEVSR